ncbi:MAG TPA: HlyD family efflux transporter periplasmic adaptor subunit [Solimonas sp.]|nr:HlyD family efflux transporter periplasmic adaptor subunit [Solimonas sp.]
MNQSVRPGAVTVAAPGSAPPVDNWRPDRRRSLRLLIGSVCALLVTAIVWAALGEVDQVVRGEGKVIPSSQLQVVQSLDGGVVSELHVRQGDTVEQGQLLARIDDVRFSAAYGEGSAKRDALEAQIARLEAEASGAGSFVLERKGLDPQVRQVELRAFVTRRAELHEAVSSLRASLSMAEQQLAMTRPLLEGQLVSKVEVLKIERDVNELKGRLDGVINAFRSKARSELSQKQAELSALGQSLRGVQDRVDRTLLHAPRRGIVKQLHVTTIGAVLKPGDPVLEIVPLEDDLIVEAYVNPADVAFLKAGLPASVRLSAFDSAIYGALTGTVELVSADSVYLEELRGSFFRVLVRTDRGYFQIGSRRANVSPGMTATVDVKTGHRTILQYLMKPLNRARAMALTER